MAAYFIVNIEIPNQQDRSNYDLYIQKVKPIVESYGGTYLVRSEKITPYFQTKKTLDRMIIIVFDTLKQLNECFNSKAYKSIKTLRETSVIANAYVVEN